MTSTAHKLHHIMDNATPAHIIVDQVTRRRLFVYTYGNGNIHKVIHHTGTQAAIIATIDYNELMVSMTPDYAVMPHHASTPVVRYQENPEQLSADAVLRLLPDTLALITALNDEG